MTSIHDIRKSAQGMLVLGNHPGIVQSILDFDYACGKKELSIVGCVTANRKALKMFFGTKEVLIPCFKDCASVPHELGKKTGWMLNVQSGRRAYESTCAFFDAFPKAHGGHIFAENVPERHAIQLMERYGTDPSTGSPQASSGQGKLIAGPSGVGLLVSGHLKLGAIGGTDIHQIEASKLATEGAVAVVSTSGGMTNELIRAVALAGKRLSFSLCIGGDRFPVSSLTQVLMLAQNDPHTSAIAYFGELGGVDEYEIAELLKSGKLTKPLVAYVAGVIDEAFDEHMQFGHAKALVAHQDESARAKREALKAAGAEAPDTFPAFLDALAQLPTPAFRDTVIPMSEYAHRQKSILSTREVVNLDDIPVFVKGKKPVQRYYGFTKPVTEALLGRSVRSDITLSFSQAIFSLLIDHGGHVSGAVNTMITARAGKDLVSSLVAGLLTVGPRFGGAVNAAAGQWLSGVAEGKEASAFVAERTKGGALLSGIGHRKYRVGVPDPRVAALAQFATLLKKHPHYDFARDVEKVTVGKNGSLILNVDGVMAALMLDILVECEKYSEGELHELVDAEFFNALFVIPRSVGFIAHFLEQKKNDEGLFRLPDELLFVRKREGK